MLLSSYLWQKLMSEKMLLSGLAKSFGIVFTIGFIAVPFLFIQGYDRILVSRFSMSLMLLWTDGFIYARAT
jgi:hypothetical protein